MSAPTPAPGDDRPREGYYPDPSIPGYVRYWNGASWVAGTSRPAPKDGEPLAPPPGVRPAAPAAASVEETGPHFFDEDPVEEPPAAAASQHGSRPEPASAWGADPAAGPGSGRVAWPHAQGADPRVPHARTGGDAATGPVGDGSGHASAGPGATTPAGSTPTGPEPGAQAGPAGAGAGYGDPAAAAADGAFAGPAYGVPDARRPAGDGSADGGSDVPSAPADAGSTFVFRRPVAGPQAAPAADAPGGDEGTITFRAVTPRPAAPGTPDAPGASPATGGPGFAAGRAAAARAAVQGTAGPQPAPTAVPAAPSGPQRAGGPAGPGVPRQTAAPQPAQQPAQPQYAASPPVAVGPGGGQSSWAQQVHRLAGAGGDEGPVAPWKPPVDDVFQAAARRQASARPAGLGKRLAARLIDTVLLAGVTAVAAVPLGTKALDHVNDKIDAAKLSGETVTVWLLDGTTATYLGIVLAVLLLFGVVYEALPTAKWGRTLGKKLLGLEVRDIEAHEPPSFGAALRRWLVYGVPGLLVVGVVGVAWCLFDRPWHQCWHDKAAGTFVAG
ncbi:RDD family protein [Streptomyces sp. NPDC003719]